MGNDVRQMEEVKEWFLEGSHTGKGKMNDLFGAVSLGGRMELKQAEDEELSCVPVEEVKELLRKCAFELGMEYEQ